MIRSCDEGNKYDVATSKTRTTYRANLWKQIEEEKLIVDVDEKMEVVNYYHKETVGVAKMVTG